MILSGILGPLQCDQCAVDYGNRTMGYCRKCCSSDEIANKNTHCEDCAVSGSTSLESLPLPMALLTTFFTVVGFVLLISLVFYFCRRLFCSYFGGNGTRSGPE